MQQKYNIITENMKYLRLYQVKGKNGVSTRQTRAAEPMCSPGNQSHKKELRGAKNKTICTFVFLCVVYSPLMRTPWESLTPVPGRIPVTMSDVISSQDVPILSVCGDTPWQSCGVLVDRDHGHCDRLHHCDRNNTRCVIITSSLLTTYVYMVFQTKSNGTMTK